MCTCSIMAVQARIDQSSFSITLALGWATDLGACSPPSSAKIQTSREGELSPSTIRGTTSSSGYCPMLALFECSLHYVFLTLRCLSPEKGITCQEQPGNTLC